MRRPSGIGHQRREQADAYDRKHNAPKHSLGLQPRKKVRANHTLDIAEDEIGPEGYQGRGNGAG